MSCNIHPTGLVYKNGQCKSCYLVAWRVSNASKCAGYEKGRDPESRKAQHRKSHYKRREKILPYQKKKCLERKTEAIRVYSDGSMKCALCPESRLYALGLDHVNGDGATQRKDGPRGCVATSLWAKKNGWPKIFRVLCHNCNWLASLLPRANPELSCYKSADKLKEQTIRHYSEGSMACPCGISDIRVLTIDHPDADGAAHRRALGVVGGSQLYRRLRQAGFPSGYRILCFSCNLATYLEQKTGSVPH